MIDRARLVLTSIVDVPGRGGGHSISDLHSAHAAASSFDRAKDGLISSLVMPGRGGGQLSGDLQTASAAAVSFDRATASVISTRHLPGRGGGQLSDDTQNGVCRRRHNFHRSPAMTDEEKGTFAATRFGPIIKDVVLDLAKDPNVALFVIAVPVGTPDADSKPLRSWGISKESSSFLRACHMLVETMFDTHRQNEDPCTCANCQQALMMGREILDLIEANVGSQPPRRVN